jgi:hypothetical protein
LEGWLRAPRLQADPRGWVREGDEPAERLPAGIERDG